MPVFSTSIDRTNLVQRTSNEETNITAANTFGTFTEIEAEVQMRQDSNLWVNATEEVVVKAMMMAYRDLVRLTWRNDPGLNQARDYEFAYRFGQINYPPIDDDEFLRDIKRAQAAQTMFIMAGTHVRDMARDGIRIHKNLSGAELEFTGYKGAVCSEAKEIMARWIENQPRMRRMH